MPALPTHPAWTDQTSLDSFAAADPHGRIVQRPRPRTTDSRVEFLHVRGADIPSDWDPRMDPVR